MKPGAASPFPLAALVTVQRGAISAEEMAMLDSGEDEQLPLNQERKGEGLRRMPRLPLTTSELIIVVSIFVMFSTALLCIYITMPSVDHKLLKLPRTVSELRILTDYVSKYTDDYKLQVLLGYCTIYIFMQTFMIPGTIVMSLLAGSLFGVVQGMALVIFTATAGASCCYFLSKLIGRPLAMWLWPDKLHFFTREVAKRRNYLFNYMLFLRVTPTLPNTFINVCSPIVNIPYPTFLVATVIGLVPATFVTVRAGLALNTLRSFNELYDVKTVGALFVIGLISIVPALVSRSQSQASDRPHSS
ncbi:hypothetical protein KC19_11G105900 [Ceratodon purpureus]|uniref:VTT domain-containing protein n=1 Tax=Ceratodon purpureus TaxID=3225 RepID=A0A8T0GH84_CERPU|nr:hypothetical protein KC19_11G105900 [Ceratodon purpureus]